VPGTAVVPPFFSPPALDVAVFGDEGRCRASTDEEGGFQELMGWQLRSAIADVDASDVDSDPWYGCRAAFPVGTMGSARTMRPPRRIRARMRLGNKRTRCSTSAEVLPQEKINPNSWIDGYLRRLVFTQLRDHWTID
jgi:hypothetical protein